MMIWKNMENWGWAEHRKPPYQLCLKLSTGDTTRHFLVVKESCKSDNMTAVTVLCSKHSSHLFAFNKSLMCSEPRDVHLEMKARLVYTFSQTHQGPSLWLLPLGMWLCHSISPWHTPQSGITSLHGYQCQLAPRWVQLEACWLNCSGEDRCWQRHLIEKHTEFSQTAGFLCGMDKYWLGLLPTASSLNRCSNIEHERWQTGAITHHVTNHTISLPSLLILETLFEKREGEKKTNNKKRPSLPVIPKWKLNPPSIHHPLTAFIFKIHFDCFVYCSLCLWLF